MVNSLHRAGIEVLLLLVLNRLYKIAIRQIRSRLLAPQPIRGGVSNTTKEPGSGRGVHVD